MKTTYNAKGLVYGKLWGGGEGAYKAEALKGYESKEDLLKTAHRMLGDGSLDSGMGYEILYGAMLDIETVQEAEIDGRIFVNKEYESEIIGKLTDEQIDFLDSIMLEN